MLQDVYVLGSTEEIEVMLDDHKIATQVMKGSNYIGPIEDECLVR